MTQSIHIHLSGSTSTTSSSLRTMKENTPLYCAYQRSPRKKSLLWRFKSGNPRARMRLGPCTARSLSGNQGSPRYFRATSVIIYIRTASICLKCSEPSLSLLQYSQKETSGPCSKRHLKQMSSSSLKKTRTSRKRFKSNLISPKNKEVTTKRCAKCILRTMTQKQSCQDRDKRLGLLLTSSIFSQHKLVQENWLRGVRVSMCHLELCTTLI